MARHHEAAQHLRDGLTPQQIAERMGIGLSSVRQYLCQQVGTGGLRRSDIAFRIEERRLIEGVLRSAGAPTVADDEPYRVLRLTREICSNLRRQGHQISPDIVELYLVTRDALPELYALICEAEIKLHRFVRQALEAEFGGLWWRKGISEPIRIRCQSRREADDMPLDEPFQYTTFIDLKSILDGNWSVFSKALPKAFVVNKKDTLQRLDRLNAIRNRVMHPVKEIIEYEEDYSFARKLLEDLSN